MAARFWVGGTGTWDSSTTTHWAATTGGAGGASVPGAADDVTFDGSSGGGTVTVNFGGTISLNSLTMGAFTGTWDNSVNNNNITCSLIGNAIVLGGSGTRTIKLGTATYTLSASTLAAFVCSITTGLTLTAGSSTIVFTGTGANTKNFNVATGLTFGTVTFPTSTGIGFNNIANATTIAHLNLTAPSATVFPAGQTVTLSNAVSWAGSSGSELYLLSGSFSTAATIAATAGSTASWAAFRDMTFTGSPIASNSFDLGHNSGITINAPSGGSGGVGVIGS